MANEDLREKFGVYARVWLILAGRPEISPNPRMADFGITREGLEEIIRKSAEQAIRKLLKVLDNTSIAITPIQISQKDFRNIIDSEKSASVKDVKEVSYKSGVGAFRIDEYQPERTIKVADRRYRISINLANEYNLGFDFIEGGGFKLEGGGYELSVYRPQDSEKKLSIENIPLKEVPEVMFSLLYKPKSFVQVEKAGITEPV